eukprot:scaffold31932_cov67-Phaeocystis_antarctica.AAC.2
MDALKGKVHFLWPSFYGPTSYGSTSYGLLMLPTAAPPMAILTMAILTMALLTIRWWRGSRPKWRSLGARRSWLGLGLA